MKEGYCRTYEDSAKTGCVIKINKKRNKKNV